MDGVQRKEALLYMLFTRRGVPIPGHKRNQVRYARRPMLPSDPDKEPRL